MFKRKIKTIIDRKIREIVKEQNKSMQTNFSYSQLSNLFKEDVFIPMTNWTISPNLVLHILHDIEINDKNCIVEFGSGASTIYIAKLLKIRASKTVFYSIESDSSWAKKINEQIKNLNLSDYVKIILAPISEAPSELTFNEQKLWYDVEILEKEFKTIQNIDLVLVDGPFGKITPFSRYSAVPFLKSKLSEKFSVYLDDASRIEEKKIVEQWKESLNCSLKFIDNYALLSTVSLYSYSLFKI